MSAWGNNWPGWSYLFSLPLSCRNSPLLSLRTSPGHGRMVTLPSQTPRTRTWCEQSQDKCTSLSLHLETTKANSCQKCCRIIPGATQDLSSLHRCPQLCKVRIWPNRYSLASFQSWILNQTATASYKSGSAFQYIYVSWGNSALLWALIGRSSSSLSTQLLRELLVLNEFTEMQGYPG